MLSKKIEKIGKKENKRFNIYHEFIKFNRYDINSVRGNNNCCWDDHVDFNIDFLCK